MTDMTAHDLKPLIQSYLELFRISVEEAKANLGFEHGPRLLWLATHPEDTNVRAKVLRGAGTITCTNRRKGCPKIEAR